MYITPGEEGEILKHGLWEKGKRIEWLTDKDVRDIKNNVEDYTVRFKNKESR